MSANKVNGAASASASAEPDASQGALMERLSEQQEQLADLQHELERVQGEKDELAEELQATRELELTLHRECREYRRALAQARE